MSLPPVPRRDFGKRPPVHPPPVSPRSNSIPTSPVSNQPVPQHQAGEKFGACLQSSYEAISKRHESELRALESMRTHLYKRARADKEYAEQLQRLNVSSRKAADFGAQSSSIVHAWAVFLDACDAVQGKIQAGAQTMSKSLLAAVDQLIRDKRGAKKVCDDERVRLDSEFTAACKEVQDLRRDYFKYLRSTEKARNTLQATMQKQSKQSELDRSRGKFVGGAKKLHGCHNDYALAVASVNVHQSFYRQTLLPFCLDTLQQRMEMQIEEWKRALTEYAQCQDLTQVYEEQFHRINDALKDVNRDVEYVQFIRDNAREQPAIEHFEFDASLLHAPCAPGNVQPGQVVLNNLTMNTMKERLQKLENDIANHNTDIAAKNKELEDLMASQDDPKPLPPGSLPKHVRVADTRAHISETESKMSKKQQQAELIRRALAEHGDNPAYLFDSLAEGVDESQISGFMTESDVPSGGKGKQSKFVKTFSRGMKKFLKSGGTKRHDSVNDDPSSPEGDEFPEADGYEDEETYEEPPEIAIEEESWYYGSIDRREAESKCRSTGDYIVRFSDRQNKFVLSVHWNNAGRHFVIQEVPDPNKPGSMLFRFEDKAFPSVRELLDYHVRTSIPVTRNSGAVLSKCIPRFDKWTIRRDDVQLGKRLGRGAFGEVMEAVLLNTNEKVAVKTCRSSIPHTEKCKFLQEAEILKQYNHPNIVNLIGVCAEKDPVYIIMEIMPGGAFLDYLRKRGPSQPKKKLTSMITDAAAGMEYLESKNCIHRDLAARNCLVGENDILKISDFGMSREEEGGIYTVSSGSRQIPIKWTAPEALNLGKYTSASDVWSFGILLWETFSFGSVPYPGMNNHEAREQVEVGYRMPPPSECPEVIYAVMQKCWHYDEDERPNFSEILNMLKDAQKRIRD